MKLYEIVLLLGSLLSCIISTVLFVVIDKGILDVTVPLVLLLGMVVFTGFAFIVYLRVVIGRMIRAVIKEVVK